MDRKTKELIDFLDWYIKEYEGKPEDTIEMIVYKYQDKYNNETK